MNHRKLIVIQGAPATGKTTLSRQLAEQLDIALVSKDSIKELLFDTLPAGDREWSRVLGKAAIVAMYAVAGALLDSGKPVMIESAFATEFARKDIAALNADVFEIFCHCDESVRVERFVTRATADRHPGHLDGQADPSAGAALLSTPLRLGATVEVDTTSGIPVAVSDMLLKRIANFIKETS